MGIELDDEELQTTPRAAAAALAGRRVLALTMHAIVGELEGIELVGEDAEAVLVGGADETPETNLVFSYMNLARAFHELEGGAQLYCLHKNPWRRYTRAYDVATLMGHYRQHLEAGAKPGERPPRRQPRKRPDVGRDH